jgi:hypothetical protein
LVAGFCFSGGDWEFQIQRDAGELMTSVSLQDYRIQKIPAVQKFHRL